LTLTERGADGLQDSRLVKNKQHIVLRSLARHAPYDFVS
jgi:hypothetical protein